MAKRKIVEDFVPNYETIDDVVADTIEDVILECATKYSLTDEEISDKADLEDFLKWFLKEEPGYVKLLEPYIGKPSVPLKIFPAIMLVDALFAYILVTGKTTIYAEEEHTVTRKIEGYSDLYLLRLKYHDNRMRKVYNNLGGKKLRAAPKIKSLTLNFIELIDKIGQYEKVINYHGVQIIHVRDVKHSPYTDHHQMYDWINSRWRANYAPSYRFRIGKTSDKHLSVTIEENISNELMSQVVRDFEGAIRNVIGVIPTNYSRHIKPNVKSEGQSIVLSCVSENQTDFVYTMSFLRAYTAKLLISQ